MKKGSLRMEAVKLAAITVSAGAALYFARAEPWTDCASRMVEVEEFGRPIRPSEDFMVPYDFDRRMEKVRKVEQEIKEGNVPGYVTRICGPKPSE